MSNLFRNLYLFLLYFSGFFDRREFIVTQHPLERTICDFWRMVWEQESRLIVSLSSIDSQECRPFWPAIIGEMLSWETNKRGDQMRLTLLEEADTLARRAIRLNLELVRTRPSSLHPPARLPAQCRHPTQSDSVLRFQV